MIRVSARAMEDRCNVDGCRSIAVVEVSLGRGRIILCSAHGAEIGQGLTAISESGG